MSKPLISFVHGACVTSWVFAPLLPILWLKGYATWAKDLPSSQGDPNTTLQHDIDFIRKEITSLLRQGYDIIPLFYSYGSNPGPAAMEELSNTDREEVEDKGGRNAEYWDSHTWSQGRPSEELFELCITLTLTGQGPVIRRRNHVALDAGLPYPGDFMKPLLTPFSTNVTAQPIFYDLTTKHDPYDQDEAGSFPVPTIYILAEGDESIPTAVQERVVKKYEGKFADVWTVQGGHLWPLTNPGKIVAELELWVGYMELHGAE